MNTHRKEGAAQLTAFDFIPDFAKQHIGPPEEAAAIRLARWKAFAAATAPKADGHQAN